MAEASEPQESAPVRAGIQPATPARTPTGATRIAHLRLAILRRLNLAGLLSASAVLCAADFALAGNVLVAILVTSVQLLLLLPWSWTVFHLDRADRCVRREERGRRMRMRGAHVVSLVLLLASLGAKALVIRDASAASFEPLVAPYRIYVVTTFAVLVLGLMGRGSRVGRFLAAMAERPARLMALSFALVALLGAFLLTLPVSLRDTAEASFVNGLFTSTSAVCVTGLTVNDISTTYTTFGHVVILALIQVGGLGIMVLSAFFTVIAGRRLRARNSAVLTEMIDADSVAELRQMLRTIVIYAFVLEAIGVAILYIAFSFHPEVALGHESPHPAAGAGSTLWSAVFHSVSAFCNAGFSLSHGNLAPFARSWAVCVPVMTLITLGGLGFPVLHEIVMNVRTRLSGRRPDRSSLHIRVTLWISALLTFGGTAAYLVLEWGRSLADLGAADRVLAAGFQSVTSRTAGFNTVDLGVAGPAALVVLCILMFIGASSGSTGGGIKTSTFAVLLATFRAELRGEAEPRILDRRVPAQTVRRAVGVAVVSIVFVVVVLFVLITLEDHDPLALVFEAISAFSTTGLSTGITSALSAAGKLVLVVTMLVGRVGPLTLAFAVASAKQRPRYVVPEGRLLIG